MGNEEKEKNEVSFINSFIPQNISNETAISFFDSLRKIKTFNKDNYKDNLVKNNKSYEKHIKSIEQNNGYIEDQHLYKDMFYGIKTIDYNGCGVISVFNAMKDLTGKSEMNLPLIIDYFEEDGITLSGIFGTAPTAIEEFFIKQGFKTISSKKEEDFEQIGKNNDSFILTFYNDKNNIFKAVHTINVSKKDGKFIGHNNGKCFKSYNSITELIHDGNSQAIFLIGIKKNNS